MDIKRETIESEEPLLASRDSRNDGIASVQSPTAPGLSIQTEMEPKRTDPIKLLEPRKRRLDRSIEERVPEIHIIGQIASGAEVISDISEGLLCRWKIETGKAWQHLGGDLMGQTQVGYARHSIHESIILSHPIDIHFAVAGLQGWGFPRFTVQCFRLDWFGRKVLAGYGFVHLPLSSGSHQLDIHLWRPVGSADQELRAFLLGDIPSLLTQDPVYESAWRDRCRILTTSSGKITLTVSVVTRYLKDQGVHQPTANKSDSSNNV